MISPVLPFLAGALHGGGFAADTRITANTTKPPKNCYVNKDQEDLHTNSATSPARSPFVARTFAVRPIRSGLASN